MSITDGEDLLSPSGVCTRTTAGWLELPSFFATLSLRPSSEAALWGHASSPGRTITRLAHHTRHAKVGICLRLIRPSNRYAPAAAFRQVARHNARPVSGTDPTATFQV